jgi:molybdate transport system substrate-binding protein
MRALAPLAAALALACRGEARTPEATLAVAASLRIAMPALIARFEAAEPGPRIVASYGGSGALRRLVEAGAPVDAVVLAGAAPVDALVAEGLARAETRRVLARGRLALVGPRGGPRLAFASLASLPAGERLAIGNPETVPAGAYAREALVALGAWERLRGRLVYAEDVAAALAYAERGEAAAAIVYESDLAAAREVELLEVAEGAFAPRPEFVAAATTGGRAAARTERFLDYLAGPEAAELLRAHGFEPASAAGARSEPKASEVEDEAALESGEARAARPERDTGGPHAALAAPRRPGSDP